MRQRGNGAVRHRRGALRAILYLGPQHVAGRPRHVRARPRLGPRARVQPFQHESAHELVPRRVKLDLVTAAAEAVEDFQHGWVAVGSIAEQKHLGRAEPLTERGDPAVVRHRPFPRKRLYQRGIRGEQIVIDELARLVRHVGCWNAHGRVCPRLPPRLAPCAEHSARGPVRRMSAWLRPAAITARDPRAAGSRPRAAGVPPGRRPAHELGHAACR